jgi:hypothetical protein
MVLAVWLTDWGDAVDAGGGLRHHVVSVLGEILGPVGGLDHGGDVFSHLAGGEGQFLGRGGGGLGQLPLLVGGVHHAQAVARRVVRRFLQFPGGLPDFTDQAAEFAGHVVEAPGHLGQFILATDVDIAGKIALGQLGGRPFPAWWCLARWSGGSAAPARRTAPGRR